MAQISYNFGFESYAHKKMHIKFPSERLVPHAQPHPSLYSIIPPTRPVPHAQPPLNLQGGSYSELTWIKIDDAARTKLNGIPYTKTAISSWIGKGPQAIARANNISVRNARIIQTRSGRNDIFVFDLDHITQIKFDEAAQKKLIDALYELYDQGFTLKDVASESGIASVTFSNWETGTPSAISRELAIKVNSYFEKKIGKTIFDLKSVLEAALKEPIDPQAEVVDAEVVDAEVVGDEEAAQCSSSESNI